MDLRDLAVIVVEDHDFQRKVAISYLTQMGLRRVLGASDGQDALDKIKQTDWPVDVALCDLDMPGMDGVQFIRHLAEGRLVGAVILLSGMESQVISSVESMARTQGMQVLGSIEKPVTAQKISNLLAKFKPGPEPHKVLPPVMSAVDVEAGLQAH